jgi:putative membrane protein
MTLLTATGVLLSSSDDHWHHPWLWPLIPLAWLLVLFLLFRFLCWPGRWRRYGHDIDPARRILAERYASGEISAEEYRKRLGDLRDA